MFVNEVYTHKGVKVAVSDVLSGGSAQDFGLSPWGDYVMIEDGVVTSDWWNDDGSNKEGVEFVEITSTLPLTRDDGSPLEEGDTTTLTVHGGSGTYTANYVRQGDDWVEAGDTIPWQMKA